jgi:flavin reductase (DIM6/NTAB) family NADH-FMN oxidoreductase RutF
MGFAACFLYTNLKLITLDDSGRRGTVNQEFRMIDLANLKDNPFRLIGDSWMLITAGSSGGCNTMTASWGGMGIIWGKNVCFCVVRPGRHTYRFMEAADSFTLSFFDESYKPALTYCGSHSGRDVDKITETGLSPVFSPNGVYFAEARLVFCCRKLYYHDIDPEHFLDPSIDTTHYPQKDYHRMYVGEVISSLVR